MNPPLSIVIANHADHAECNATIASIQSTAGDVPEIVVVDDGSSPPFPGWDSIRTDSVRVIRNQRRIGCGPSRYVGACHAKGEFLQLLDSHCRFTEGWYEAAMRQVSVRPTTLHCAVCLGLDRDNMDVNRPRGLYCGATVNFYGKDRNKPSEMQVFECVWRQEKTPGNYEIPAVMGAAYFISREWFIYLNALRNLKVWGSDELELSLKAWMAGGDVRLLGDVRIGHKFKSGKLNKISPADPLANKLFVMHSCLPPAMALTLQKKLPRNGHTSIALQRLYANWHEVETARAYNASIFKRDFISYLNHHSLTFPMD